VGLDGEVEHQLLLAGDDVVHSNELDVGQRLGRGEHETDGSRDDEQDHDGQNEAARKAIEN
jgi:hypothetical protein